MTCDGQALHCPFDRSPGTADPPIELGFRIANQIDAEEDLLAFYAFPVLMLTLSAATSIAVSGLSAGEQIVVLAVFVILASATVAAPVLVYLIAGEGAEATLNRMKAWLIANNNTIMAILLLVIGVKLVGDGIGILSS